jgi:hypothetical protein
LEVVEAGNELGALGRWKRMMESEGDKRKQTGSVEEIKAAITAGQDDGISIGIAMSTAMDQTDS